MQREGKNVNLGYVRHGGIKFNMVVVLLSSIEV